MRRFRSFLAVSVLLAFAWCRAAEAMPLVWCLGSDGHSVVEIANSEGCKSYSGVDVYVDLGYATTLVGLGDGAHDTCNDFVLSDEARASVKVFKTLAPPEPASIPIRLFEDRGLLLASPLDRSPNPAASQLAQLRTVVLRL